VPEIINTLAPQLCPYDNSSVFRAQALLCLLLPSSSFSNELVGEIFDKWAWIGILHYLPSWSSQ